MRIKKCGFSASALAILVVGLGTSIPATQAGEQRESFEFTVSFADLNLDNEQGARTLFYRIRSAARDACGVGSSHYQGSLLPARTARECFRETMANAVNQLGVDLASRLPVRERRSLEMLLAMQAVSPEDADS